MTFRSKLVGAGTAAVLAGAVSLMPATAATAAPAVAPAASVAAAKPAPASVPVTGTMVDGSAFTGAISDLKVSKAAGGGQELTGTITGAGLPAGGTDFTAPVSSLAVDSACTILTLDLGPLHLDLLGLVIDLAPVNLDVTAVPGAGNLLGNLLCAVAGLLDGGGPLGVLNSLINRILSGLGL